MSERFHRCPGQSHIIYFRGSFRKDLFFRSLKEETDISGLTSADTADSFHTYGILCDSFQIFKNRTIFGFHLSSRFGKRCQSIRLDSNRPGYVLKQHTVFTELKNVICGVHHFRVTNLDGGRHYFFLFESQRTEQTVLAPVHRPIVYFIFAGSCQKQHTGKKSIYNFCLHIFCSIVRLITIRI